MSEELQPSPSNGPAFGEAVRQFRQEIGGFRAVRSPSRKLPQPTAKRRYRHKLTTTLCLLTLVMAGVKLAPILASPDAVPAELVGSWATDDRRYEGRYLELTTDALIFRAGAREGTEYAVRRVQRRQMPQGSAYVINAYSERAGEYTLTLEYREAEHTIALGNTARALWRRAR